MMKLILKTLFLYMKRQRGAANFALRKVSRELLLYYFPTCTVVYHSLCTIFYTFMKCFLYYLLMDWKFPFGWGCKKAFSHDEYTTSHSHSCTKLLFHKFKTKNSSFYPSRQCGVVDEPQAQVKKQSNIVNRKRRRKWERLIVGVCTWIGEKFLKFISPPLASSNNKSNFPFSVEWEMLAQNFAICLMKENWKITTKRWFN